MKVENKSFRIDEHELTTSRSWLDRLAINRYTRSWIQQWVKGRDVRMLTGLGKGLKFNAGSADPDFSIGSYERPMQKILAAYLSKGDVFYDIGANAGFFSVLAARIVEDSGQVYAFEPVPENLSYIRHNLEINAFGHVKAIPKAVSSHPGQGELFLASYSGGSALSNASPPPDLKGTLRVDITSVDAFIYEEGNRPPDLIKIDVEGAEAAVLTGMQKTLELQRPAILYEIDDHERESFDEKKEACEKILRAHEYQIHALPESYQYVNWLVEHFLALPN